METSFDPLVRRLETTAGRLVHGGVLGIDIGSSSAKVVQLSMREGQPAVETYGEIDLGPYGDRAAKKAVQLETKEQSNALLDLINEVGATARKGGMSIPLSSTLISIVRMPKRDPEQMRRIMPTEAQRYIPVPIESVEIDWMPVGGEEKADAFAQAEANKSVQTHQEDVMLVAVEKRSVQALRALALAATLSIDFYEVEMFSAVRACVRPGVGATLVADLGASGSKLYIVNGRGMPLAAHAVPIGGEAVTEEIKKALGCSFEKAEEIKCTRGLHNAPSYTKDENVRITAALEEILARLCAEMTRAIEDAGKGRGVDVGGVTLLGGGALLPGMAEYASKHLNTAAVLADPFAQAHVPMVLEDVARAAGPKFAVAMGLALRSLRA